MGKDEIVQSTLSALRKSMEETTDPEKVALLSDRLMSAVDRLGEEDKSSGLWDLEQGANHLGIKKDTLRKRCNQQKVPHIRIGNRIRFDPVRFRKWAISREIPVHKVWR